MAERRMIATRLWRDEWFGPLDSFSKLLWIALFSACSDDQGRMIDSPILIRADAFPYEDIDIAQIETTLERFASDHKLLRYTSDGKRFIQIITWREYQRPQWAQPSRWPAPEGWKDRVRTRLNANDCTYGDCHKRRLHAPMA